MMRWMGLYLCLSLMFVIGCGKRERVGTISGEEIVSDTTSSKWSIISGKVLDALTGSPVEGVQIELGDKVSRTDSNGLFSVEGVSPGDYIMKLSRNGYAEEEKGISVQGDPADLEIYIYPTFEIKGEVIDGSNGEPLEGVYIGFGDISNPFYTFTDSDGKFRIEIPMRSSAEIYGTAYKKGYMPQALSIRPEAGKDYFFRIILYPRTCGCG